MGEGQRPQAGRKAEEKPHQEGSWPSGVPKMAQEVVEARAGKPSPGGRESVSRFA